MKTIKEILNATKAAQGIESDYALAKALGIPSQRVCDYYKGRRVPDEFACLRIAEVLGKDYAEISATVRIEAEKDESRKEVWRKYYKSIGGVAAGFMLFAFSIATFFTTATPAQAAQTLEKPSPTLYIM